jgi:predicted site-specific integrase-resolvase
MIAMALSPADLLDTIGTAEWAALHGISRRRATQYCEQGLIEGARLEGRDYRIPRKAAKPRDRRFTRWTLPKDPHA